MTKNRQTSNIFQIIVGAVDILLGVSQIIIFLFMSLFVTRQLTMLYSQLNLPSNNSNSPIIPVLIITFGIINIILGSMLIIKSKNNKNNFIVYGIISATIGFFLLFFYQISVISSIYNLTTNF